MINADVRSMDTDFGVHLSQNVSRRQSNKLDSAPRKLMRHRHLLLLMALYIGTAVTKGLQQRLARQTHDYSQTLLNTNINKVCS